MGGRRHRCRSWTCTRWCGSGKPRTCVSAPLPRALSSYRRPSGRPVSESAFDALGLPCAGTMTGLSWRPTNGTSSDSCSPRCRWVGGCAPTLPLCYLLFSPSRTIDVATPRCSPARSNALAATPCLAVPPAGGGVSGRVRHYPERGVLRGRRKPTAAATSAAAAAAAATAGLSARIALTAIGPAAAAAAGQRRRQRWRRRRRRRAGGRGAAAVPGLVGVARAQRPSGDLYLDQVLMEGWDGVPDRLQSTS